MRPPSATLAREVMANGSASFTLASRIFPTDIRDDVAILYAWCRRADDAVDEAPLALQQDRVDQLQRELESVYSGDRLDEPLLAAFQDLVERRRIPRHHATDLLEGMAMDASRVPYLELADLILYCYRAAGTVGLMMCHVMGLRSDAETRFASDRAADLGIAMQLTNICRDVAEDWGRGRLYLPDSMLARAGASGLRHRLGQPFPRDSRGAVATVTRELLVRAEEHYRSGDAGLHSLSTRCALAVRAARLVYAEIGREIARAAWDPLAGRAVVPTRRKVQLVVRACCDTWRRWS